MSELEDYKTVLIVGNGFDRNIGMKTAYSEFMESELFKDIISKGENTFLKYLESKNRNYERWVDIEIELGKYASMLNSQLKISDLGKEIIDTKRPSDVQNEFKNDYIKLCNVLKEYLNIENSKIPDKMMTKSSIAYKLIKDMLQDRTPFCVINFNYTKFVESIVKCLNDTYVDYCIRYIHGSLDSKSDIVFGVQDSLILKREHVFLYKSYSKYKNVRGLPLIFEKANKIIFFGYSLGETDHSYFDDFFRAQTQPNCKEKEFIFYHYGSDAYDDIIWNLKLLTNNRTAYLNQYNKLTFIDSSKTK